ncbi:hypothetical protein MGG_16257 [Pyricularia oryzae 70-15]|uniref:Uncharacterized protein n=1 Tax=Pyricularia oryzae (strain 70-15 / ATCC MYA-4617 / FGSC 8958) TaxID=242507 RepID=G4MQ73_PYRO7|nr:uncharacterized protein MGG_16257 [Pyricularia oryzae 70-15]EHA57266.1 hypothetical protein MGG_16257 [Pyricularia oryzae 70-15]KAI7923075.1 hypothetical protein M0657_005253 [Pyricularia oryzae]KAI7925996.1 hypothetical protein M9X92_002952 [Pyricularia oryzae]
MRAGVGAVAVVEVGPCPIKGILPRRESNHLRRMRGEWARSDICTGVFLGEFPRFAKYHLVPLFEWEAARAASTILGARG